MDMADTTIGGRFGRFGPGAARLAVAAALVLLVLGATAGAAGAQNNGGPSGPRATFIKNCQKTGGTTMEGAGDMKDWVFCTHRNPDGSITDVDCEFIGPYLWHCTGGTRPGSNLRSTSQGELGGAVSDGTKQTLPRAQTATPAAEVERDDDEQR